MAGLDKKSCKSPRGNPQALLNLCLLVSSTLMLSAAEGRGQVEREESDRGRRVYMEKCVFCHGEDGNGAGPASSFLDPSPRDFTNGIFKIRSTHWMSLPTDEDLFDVVTKGMPGTGMPDWADLSETDRRAVVSYLKRFSSRFATESPGDPVASDGKPAGSAELLQRGRELFHRSKCFLCHGKEGRGDGPITVTLWQEWKRPFRARDLTRRDQFRGGGEVEDIFRTVSTGLNGTPMGAYDSLLTVEERWALAHYVRSLSEKQIESGGVVLRSKKVNGDIPRDRSAALWSERPHMMLDLGGQVIRRPRLWNPTVSRLSIRSLYNEKEVAFLIEWNDPTCRPEHDLRDAVAIQFAADFSGGSERPYFLQGTRDRPVLLWQWRSGQSCLPDSAGGTVDALLAFGIDRLAPGEAKATLVEGDGVWHSGEWSVLLIGKRVTPGVEGPVLFPAGELLPVAFSAWDGSNNEYGPRVSLSSWYYLGLEVQRPRWALLLIGAAFLSALFLADSAFVRLRRK